MVKIGKHGLTLIEVIISALILSMTVGGVLFIFTTEKIAVSRTGRKRQAMDFARQTLEELKNAVGADTWPDAGELGTVGVDITDPLSASDLRDKFGGYRSYTVRNIDADSAGEPIDYKRVTVTVSWDEP